MRYRTLKILVVDDKEEYLKSLEAILKDEKFVVFTSSNGHDALACIQLQKPDLVLMDVNMPKMDGIATLKRIRKISKDTWLPVILTSANASITDQLKGYDAHCDEFLPKPIEPRLLVAKIKVFQRILHQNQIPA